jgi:chromosome segregation ATPase
MPDPVLEMQMLEMQSRAQHMRGSLFDLKRKKISFEQQLREIERSIPITEKQIDELEQSIEEFKNKNNL